MATIERGEVVLNYEVRGGPEWPAVVLLHGFTSDLRVWHALAGTLERDFFVVMPDLRGHGRSSAPEDIEAYSVPACAEDVLAVMDELGLDLVALVGCSYGGMVALQLAVEHPERVAALVLTDTSAAYEDPRYEPVYFERERGIDAMAAEVELRGVEAMGKRAAANISDPFLAAATRRQWEARSAAGVIGTAHARRTRPNLLGQLGERLTMPVLVCIGEEDPVASASRVMAGEVRGARVVTFAATGHGVPFLRHDAFRSELVAFFRDVEGGEPIGGERSVAAPKGG